MIANDTFKDVSIDENTHDQSLIELQNPLNSQIINDLIPILAVRLNFFMIYRIR